MSRVFPFVLIAMLLYHLPAHASRWLAPIGLWLITTILIVAGNYIRFALFAS
jgi:hypothetical protein